jgi:hypothetical protein
MKNNLQSRTQNKRQNFEASFKNKKSDSSSSEESSDEDDDDEEEEKFDPLARRKQI